MSPVIKSSSQIFSSFPAGWSKSFSTDDFILFRLFSRAIYETCLSRWKCDTPIRDRIAMMIISTVSKSTLPALLTENAKDLKGKLMINYSSRIFAPNTSTPWFHELIRTYSPQTSHSTGCPEGAVVGFGTDAEQRQP
jgi:hypothetical protein